MTPIKFFVSNDQIMQNCQKKKKKKKKKTKKLRKASDPTYTTWKSVKRYIHGHISLCLIDMFLKSYT